MNALKASAVENTMQNFPIQLPTNPRGFFVPTMYFLVAGAGDAEQELVAFDRALISAGVADVNLVKLSSIVPPGCRHINVVELEPGSFVGVAFAHLNSDRRGQRIASAVAVAHPTNPKRPSLVMEYSDFALSEQVERIVIEMARTGIESRGLEVARVESVAVEHIVDNLGATFAAVVEI